MGGVIDGADFIRGTHAELKTQSWYLVRVRRDIDAGIGQSYQDARPWKAVMTGNGRHTFFMGSFHIDAAGVEHFSTTLIAKCEQVEVGKEISVQEMKDWLRQNLCATRE